LTGLDVGIKWVNDLFLNGRKVAGILAEGELSPTGELEYIILGFGINVAAASLPSAVADIATSLEAEGCRPDRAELIAALLEEWESAYATITDGDFLEDSRRLSVVLGKAVTVIRGEEAFPAAAEAIDDKGQLVVRTAEGLLTLTGGEVSLRL
jgi:BirA family biotin operon repressor/biotin-[acetyl-CoA-carboxylase] ligase